ncbi:helix-turn-helix domain-containing protein [Streptosporangium sp. NPDC004631]
MSDFERLMRPQEVADIYDVDIKTVAQWIKSGRLPATRTPGGRYRVRAATVEELLKVEVETKVHVGKAKRQTPPKTAGRILASDLAMLPRLPECLLAVERDLAEHHVKRGDALPQEVTYLDAIRKEIARRQTIPTL